jgi:putative ABC transport system permease protein
MHFIKAIFRNFYINRYYTLINITGLTVGLASVMFILLYLKDELTYDRFHLKRDRIFRLESDFTISGSNQRVAKTPIPFGPAFKREFPEVEEYVRFQEMPKTFFRYHGKEFYESGVFFADSTVFDVFTFHFLSGSSKNALCEPNSMVMTNSFARKYFGDENPLGKIITMGNGLKCKITGVIDDLPGNSHLRFDALVARSSYAGIIGDKAYRDLESHQFWAIRLYTYILLREHTDIQSIHAKFPAFHEKYMAAISKQFNGTYRLMTHPLTRIHLYSGLGWDLPTGDIRKVFVFATIALFVLLLAGANYINLATARSVTKAREVGIRKVLGSSRREIIRFFLAESIVLSFIACLLAIMVVELLIPVFNDITGKHLPIDLRSNILTYLLFVFITLLIGLISGSYPSFYLSSFMPVRTLKGDLISRGRKSALPRRLLIVFQFLVASVMIIGTITIMKQLHFMKTKELGFDRENILIFQLNDMTFKRKMQTFKNEVLQNPDVRDVSVSNNLPGSGIFMDVMLIEGQTKMEEQLVTFMDVDDHFFDLLGMKILAGRNFDKRYGTDTIQAVIINQTAARQYDWDDQAIGKKITRRSDKYQECKVIGVVNDIHCSSLHEMIGPTVFFDTNLADDFLIIRIEPENKAGTLTFLEIEWKKFNTSEPFIYTFLDESLADLYDAEDRMLKIIGYFSFFSIFISLLGMLGLSSFITEQSSKNIGIRKVLGATTVSVIYLLSADFLKYVIIGFFVAVPIAWYIMDRWLQNFAYRVDIKAGWFIWTGIIIITLAQLTVTFQTIRAARTNPAVVIKYE